MRGSREDLPATMESDQVIVQEAEWADIHVGFETYNEEFDLAPLLRGLPDDMCQCPHYGYVLKGRMRVRYADREEVFEAGDAYYIDPGHSPIMEAGTEIVEFSPKDEYRKTMEVAERNLAAMQEG
jgi:mannose-6-phosphate isomerase-like protein (cupin superfamily)